MTRALLTGHLLLTIAASTAHAQLVTTLPGEDRPLAPTLTEVYRLGSAAADADWQVFSAIPAAGFDGDGNLYLLDAPSRVVIVGPDGGLLSQFGGIGEGPGEFGDPGQLDVWPSGRMVVLDMGRGAYHLFGPGGAFERRVRMKIVQPDIYWSVRAHAYGARPVPRETAVFSDGGRDILRIDLSSEEVRTETFVEAWAPPGTEIRHGSLADVTAGGLWGFEPPLVFDALPDGGIAFSDSTAYAIKITDPSGDLLRVLSRPIQPHSVTEQIKERERARRLAELTPSRNENIPPSARAMLALALSGGTRAIEDMQFFPEIPVIHALRTTWEGMLWVQRRGDGSDVDRGPIDVLDPNGRYVGTIVEQMRMPDEFGPDGLVVFLEKDEFDVPVIVVKRLPPSLR